jgi:predicted lipase
MNCKELKEITSKFTDVSNLLEEQKLLHRKISRVRRKLRTKYNEYKFLQELVGIDIKGEILENALKQYFKKIGFEKVDKVGKKYKEEDIRVEYNNILLLVEVKGAKQPIIDDDRIFQVLKHIPNKQKTHPEKNVYGVFVCNHDNLKSLKERKKDPFDERVKKLIFDSKLCVITTIELIKIFVKIEQGLMTKDDFIRKLCKPGVLII